MIALLDAHCDKHARCPVDLIPELLVIARVISRGIRKSALVRKPFRYLIQELAKGHVNQDIFLEKPLSVFSSYKTADCRHFLGLLLKRNGRNRRKFLPGSLSQSILEVQLFPLAKIVHKERENNGGILNLG